jgi:hypothetical protein
VTKPPVPPPPLSLPEQPSFRQASKYQHTRLYLSWWGLFIGLVLGFAGGLYIAWVEFPPIEFDTRPDQLTYDDKAHYVVAIALQYAYDSDLGVAIQRLTDLELGADPLQAVADMTCDLLNRGYAQTSAGLRAVRAMRTFYTLQGRSSCADDLIPDVGATAVVEIAVATSTPTLPPPPSKTPVGINPTPTESGIVIVPTTAPQRAYEGSIFNTFCSLELNGIIEVYVRDFDNTEGIPGERIRVQWEGGSSVFVSGLKPERDPGYADFQMEAGGSYIISMPGRSDPITSTIVADGCFTDTGEEAITSYRVAFVRVGG